MTPLEKVSSLSDAEQAYLARWIAAIHPDIAEEALTALTRYRSQDPETARLMLGPESDQSRCPAVSASSRQCIITPGHSGLHRDVSGDMWEAKP